MRALLIAVLLIGAVAVVGLAVYQSEEPPPQPGDGIDLVRADYAGIDRAVNEKKGSVVLVDFWATSCAPCREKFPHFVTLHKRYAADGLACISVCYDPDPEDREPALRMLREWRATMQNFHFPDRTREDQARMRERFAVAGFLPHAAIFNRAGERVWDSWNSRKTPVDLEQIVMDELAKK